METRLPGINYAILERGVLPMLRWLIRRGYFSFEVEGAEHVPRSGPVIYVANHSGWFFLECFFFALGIYERCDRSRIPFTFANDLLLKVPVLRQFLDGIGAVPASWLRDPERIPPDVECLGLFPEGVEGNSKPFWHAYRLRRWHSGFVRLALARGVPVLPMAFIGGEEALPVLWPVRLFKPLVGAAVPLPLFPLPLPSRWKVIFLEPVDLSPYKATAEGDPEQCRRLARMVQDRVQAVLDRETRARPLARLARRLSRS